MQDIDNNMDELFRKAGAGYPLKSEADGWDKIAPMLLETPAITHVPNKKNSLKKYTILIILLLAFFLFGTLTSKYIWKKDINVAAKQTNPILPVNDASAKKSQTIPNKNQSLPAQTKTSLNKQLIIKKSRVSATYSIPDYSEISSNDGTVNVKQERNTAELSTTLQSGLVKNTINDNTEKSDGQDVSLLKKTNDTLVNTVALQLLKKVVDSIPATTNGTPPNDRKKKVKSNQLNSRFYIGVLGGVSFNQVKSQGLQKPGFDVGFKVGHQFTKQLSIETGLLFEQKYYYTSGEYFNISKIASAMPVGMKVLSLKGKFSVFELPLTLKYNLPTDNTQGHFYTTAGISTYLMGKEYNQYKTLLNGIQNNMTGIYNNQSTYSAASLNMSIGYEKAIGKSVLVRVEPYIQLPLKGLGVGDLPVTTVGVHLGVFHFKK